jgi:NTE family protein
MAATEPENTNPIIGLALSGGGFRATAFHLGVLIRLRELGLLSRIQLISTVSGGSIAGAFWVTVQAKLADTLNDDAAWKKFVASLVAFMAWGLRETIFIVTFVFPSVFLIMLLGVYVLIFGPISTQLLVGITVVILVLSYLSWHYFATSALQSYYEKWLFGETSLDELDPAILNGPCPILLINATGLNTGEHLIFPTRQPPTDYENLFNAVVLKTAPKYALIRGMPPISMPSNIKLAEAVAASSALPGAFAPIVFTKVLNQVVGFLRTPIWGKSGHSGIYYAVDGGVFDNQGTRLLSTLCQHLIISDGSASLKEDISPSTWQIWPLGKGVVFRTQEIIYSRVKELGYQMLESRHALYRTLMETLQDHKIDEKKIEQIKQEQGQFLESYSYIELKPRDTFGWLFGKQRLPEKLIPYVSTIRTDLDSFSMQEISALMFHGYTMIDHCLSTYQAELLPASPPPLNFDFPTGGIFKDWDKPTEEEIDRAIAHLSVSTSPFGAWRRLYRFILKC